MWSSLCPELHLVVTIICIKITESLSGSGVSSSMVGIPQVYAPQPRSASFLAGNSRLSPMINPSPYQYSSNGYSIPSGATSLQQRSYSNYGSPNSYSAYPLSYTNNNAAALSSPSYTSSAEVPLQASVRSFAPADPTEPDDPTDTDSSKKAFAAMSIAPRFNAPVMNNPGINTGISPAAGNGGGVNMQNFMANQDMGNQNAGFLANQNPGAAPLDARSSFGNAAASADYGIGSNYASATPAGASYSGPANSYAQATGYGKEGYAESSPNTAYGSIYNKANGSSYPSYYGATPRNYGLGSFPSTGFSPLYFYFPVEYGYDQGEQTVMPTGGIPLIGYKRRYGYRHGPFYGYGIYVDYPPYFGFGKVKDGWGSDPEADLMAATALDQGAGASVAQSAQASNGNQNAQSNGGYGSSGNGYGSQYGTGQMTGYGSSPSTGSYGAASSAVSQPYSSNSASPGAYSAQSPSVAYGSGAAPASAQYGQTQQSYAAPSSGSSQYATPSAGSTQYAAPASGNSQYSYYPASNDQSSQNGSSQTYRNGGAVSSQQYAPGSSAQSYPSGSNGAQYSQGSQFGGTSSQYGSPSYNGGK